MPDFHKRSYKKELLDNKDNAFSDIKKNMAELNFINTHLGGHSITISGFKQLLASHKLISVCEIGCGGGDNLQAIKKYTDNKNIIAQFIGNDISQQCIDYARSLSANKNVQFICSDYQLINFNTTPDIIFSSLFCHHFTDDEIILMLQWMKENSTTGFFINDLHRHPLAYYFIRITTFLFSGSKLVKNDAPLSVLRAFKKKEWIKLLDQAGIKNYSIKWKWAFRYLIVCKNG